MVHVVNNSLKVYDANYRETNIQLAKENSELRLALSEAISHVASNKEEIHRKDVELIKLKTDLEVIRKKYDSIVSIVLDNELPCSQRLAIEGPPPQQDPSHHQTINRENVTNVSNHNQTHSMGRISERTEEESTSLNSTYYDSLDPPEVTSVPPINQSERLDHTPSIWKILDNTLPQQRSIYMFESTPIKDHHKTLDKDKKRRTTEKRPIVPDNPDPPRYNLRKRNRQ